MSSIQITILKVPILVILLPCGTYRSLHHRRRCQILYFRCCSFAASPRWGEERHDCCERSLSWANNRSELVRVYVLCSITWTNLSARGDTIQVTVNNNLDDEPVAIHWHGFLQTRQGWEDGIPGVTQCPIPPGKSFTYNFKAELYGTSWWHAHVSAQCMTLNLFSSLFIYSDPPRLCWSVWPNGDPWAHQRRL